MHSNENIVCKLAKIYMFKSQIHKYVLYINLKHKKLIDRV